MLRFQGFSPVYCSLCYLYRRVLEAPAHLSALHHNKRKTNYHIHLIFSERILLPETDIKHLQYRVLPKLKQELKDTTGLFKGKKRKALSEKLQQTEEETSEKQSVREHLRQFQEQDKQQSHKKKSYDRDR